MREGCQRWGRKVEIRDRGEVRVETRGDLVGAVEGRVVRRGKGPLGQTGLSSTGAVRCRGVGRGQRVPVFPFQT